MSALSFYFAKAAVSIHYGKNVIGNLSDIFFGYDCKRHRM